MLQFQGVEVLLELPHMYEVCYELGIVATALPSDLFNDQLRISLHQELSDPQRDRASVRPKIKASYSAMLLVALNSRCTMYFS